MVFFHPKSGSLNVWRTGTHFEYISVTIRFVSLLKSTLKLRITIIHLAFKDPPASPAALSCYRAEIDALPPQKSKNRRLAAAEEQKSTPCRRRRAEIAALPPLKSSNRRLAAAEEQKSTPCRRRRAEIDALPPMKSRNRPPATAEEQKSTPCCRRREVWENP